MWYIYRITKRSQGDEDSDIQDNFITQQSKAA